MLVCLPACDHVYTDDIETHRLTDLRTYMQDHVTTGDEALRSCLKPTGHCVRSCQSSSSLALLGRCRWPFHSPILSRGGIVFPSSSRHSNPGLATANSSAPSRGSPRRQWRPRTPSYTASSYRRRPPTTQANTLLRLYFFSSFYSLGFSKASLGSAMTSSLYVQLSCCLLIILWSTAAQAGLATAARPLHH